MTDDRPLWEPAPARVARANLTAFARANARGPDYAELWGWSVDEPAEFWAAVWRDGGVIADARDGSPWDDVVIGLDRMAPPDPVLGPRWFTGARLNFAENLLRR